MAEYTESICRRCFHSYVCEQFNEHRDDNNKKCHFFNDHFVPAADVAPVVHAKWIDGADAFGAKRGQYRVCSRCNICIPCVSELAAPYWRGCPNCLARMDGETNG